MKEADHEVIYLGQSVPYSDVLATGSILALRLHYGLHSPQSQVSTLGCLPDDLGGAFPDKKILYFSSFLGEHPGELTQNHIRMHTLQDFIDYL